MNEGYGETPTGPQCGGCAHEGGEMDKTYDPDN